MKDENRNVVWAGAFVDELARAGVRHVCIASGSRGTPLVLAFAADPRFRLHPHVDERSAAYFALGAARGSGRPAAVVTTSGTAVANLFPAVVEASQAEVPLLLLTADRPGHLRGLDANQTIEQPRIFGAYPRLSVDVRMPEARPDLLRHVRALAARAVAAAEGVPAGPVHLNFPFEKPLEPRPVPGDVPADLPERAPRAVAGRPSGAPFTRVRPATGRPSAAALAALADRLRAARRPLLVAGPAARDDPGPAAVALAAAAGCPLLADPLSGARFAPGAARHAVPAYDLLLGDREVAAKLRPDLVLRLGPAPTSATLGDFLRDCGDVDQVVVDPGGRWKDHPAVASEYVVAEPTHVCADLAEALEAAGADTETGWTESWRRAGRAALEAARREAAAAFFEGAVPAAVAEGLPAGATLFIGSSMPVRDLDAYGAPRDEPLRVLGHRGASGIDGAVSGALGAAAAVEGPTAAVLGDLSFYHDMNGLLAARREPPDLVLVVIHNDGGGIFHMLPVREREEAFLPYVVMPHGLDFRHAAALYGLPYRRLGPEPERPPADGGRPDLLAGLRTALAEELAAGGTRILEVSSDREGNRRRHEEVRAAALAAARGALAEAGEEPPPAPERTPTGPDAGDVKETTETR